MEADIREIYDSDPRPTFLVDCNAQPAAICHINKALHNVEHVAQSLHHHDAFRDWWDPASKVAARHRNEFRHGRSRWAKFTTCKRWLVVCLVEQAPRPEEEPRSPWSDAVQVSRIAPPRPRFETIFTVKIQSRELREHIDHLRTINWAATSLGPIESWSYELNSIVMTLMLDTRPTALFLGPKHTIVYNLAYGSVSGSRHPKILGKSIIDAWPELADPVSATVARSQETRFADAAEEEYHFMVERNGFVEESFFLWSLIPLGGLIDGMYSIVTEVTKQRLLERRVDALLRLSQLSSEARNEKAFWTSIVEAIKPYEYDFPAAILYSSGPSKSDQRKCKLEWTIGYADEHPAIPNTLDLEQDHVLARAFLECSKKRVATLYSEEDGVLPDALFKDTELRGFGDPCRAFIVIPVKIYDETIIGYLIVGLNTRRPYDAEYKEWIEVFSNLIGTSAASVALYEEEVRNRKLQEEQAAKDREALSAEVAVLAQEANHVAEKLRNFHDVVNGIGLGYFEFDTDGRLTYANEAYFTQTGHRRDLANLPPLSFLDCVYDPDRDGAMEQWEKSIAGGCPTVEVRWRKKPDPHSESGNTRDYLWTVSNCMPIKSEDGKITGVFGCNTDITAQKEAEKAAILQMEAERRLANFTELAPIGFYQLNSDLEMQYCNNQWFQITGHPKVPVKEIAWRRVILPQDLEGIYRDVDLVSRTQGSHTFSFRIQKLWTGPDGISTPTWLLATVCTHLYEEGSMSIMGTINDISHLKWAESVQRNRVEEALESKRQQENFIDMTSHEMRNPLSAMVQCADSISSSLGEMAVLASESTLLSQTGIQTNLKDLIGISLDAVETIQACATHQKRIVDDILTLSKLDSKLLVISPTVMQPAVLLQDVYKMFKEEAAKSQITLEARCDPSFTDMNIDHAILDPSRVLQVLINLLTNAIKFTQDQPVRKVEILMSASTKVEKRPEVEYVPQQLLGRDEAKPDDNTFYLHFTVKDTGCGLSAEHKAKLFLRFSQASPKTHVQYGGSGLGLFISRELTEMQGGSIGVQSSQGVGSTFSFYIRSKHATPPGADLTKLSISPPVKTHTLRNDTKDPPDQTSSQPHSPQYHILVVEDNLINQRVLCNQLKRYGCTVQVANHGGEALNELSKTTYYKDPTVFPPFKLSVVLMDVEMPIMDGLTCARKIRELQDKGDVVGHVPIIAVSANARREQVEQAKQAGMDDAISKPFRIPELMATINGLLSRPV